MKMPEYSDEEIKKIEKEKGRWIIISENYTLAVCRERIRENAKSLKGETALYESLRGGGQSQQKKPNKLKYFLKNGKNMSIFEIEFHNRKKEITEIMNIMKSPPSLVTFIYGPINSGKTELVNHVIASLPDNYAVFYINLRGKFISKYEDFIRVLFRVERGEQSEIIKALLKQSIKVLNLKGIPVSESIVDSFFSKNEDPFEFLEEYFTRISEKKQPVLIIDELQKIGDVKINGSLIYELFNLFVRLTKELHLCHVFAISSDSLFIERVYSEAMLQGRCEYVLVEDFDHETTVEFLRKYGFAGDEINLVWEYFGGKPVYLIRAVRAKKTGENIHEVVDTFFNIRVSQIKDVIYDLEENDAELFRKVVDAFLRFDDREEFEYERLGKEIRFCVEKNILFVEPIRRIVKPQSRLDLMAIRKVVKDLLF
jgi:AAA+ ATPase superfamily predicted ATPase